MATNLLPINSLTIRASAASDTRVTDNRRRSSPPTAPSNGKWWSPLFGWSADADYIDNNNNNNNNLKEENIPARSENIPARSARFTPGGFTEEKAKQLRLMTKESFHDVMYHSAIASRLASDFSDNNGGQ